MSKPNKTSCRRPVRSRMLLRFFASLVVCNVILPSSLLSLLLDVVSAARSSAEAGAGGDGRLWQPWADHLVYSALISLPWAGSELAEGLDDDMDALLVAVGGYMSMRPKEHSAALMPFRGGGPDDEDRCKR